jgi:hypothetical protein
LVCLCVQLEEAEEKRKEKEQAKALPAATGPRVQADPNASITPWMDEEVEEKLEPSYEVGKLFIVRLAASSNGGNVAFLLLLSRADHCAALAVH